ncbi:MAG: type 1 glutamine amidotransferase [Rhodocyclaceae bacterium]|nr:type 1 glutamine amidotransferase [Rhodocyclaceae bacterium]
MKPVAIFRHSPAEGPGYFATFLENHSIPWQLFSIDAGDSPPASPEEFAGLCFMGGPMSVNDDLPWLPLAFALIQKAVDLNIPVIGHCLGGQLMSRALGGIITKNPVKELGWGEVIVTDLRAVDWLGEMDRFEAFHWHGETFSIPPGATRLLASRECANQAFVLGPHLGLQCHVEMTEPMIRLWNQAWADEKASPSPSVQTPDQMMEHVEPRIAAMRQAANRLYTHWIAHLAS